MKRSLVFFCLLVFYFNTYCQDEIPVRGEFADNPNGLMYSESDISSLRFIVDSLNLRFKSCDLTKTYYSQPQTRIWSVRFTSDTSNLQQIIADLHANISPGLLLEKYRRYIYSSDTSVFIIQSAADKYLTGSPGKGYENIRLSDEMKFNTNTVVNRWLYTYYEKSRYYRSNSLTCHYFPAPFLSKPIPDKYGRLIQYVDCMIDTSSLIFLTRKTDSSYKSIQNSYKEVCNYLNAAMKNKKKGKNDWEFNSITAEKIAFAKEKLKDDADFIKLMNSVTEDCVKSLHGGDELEELIAFFVSKEKALLLKRSRRVVGSCSQDTRPREHARDIAILAAQAHSWDIFLRAHLNIMNDRFERMSDGSYAWGQRKTYLKELEELNLNIVDLMLGLTLRAGNTASNHYYGTIWRMGWALTESKDKVAFEQKAIEMMKDNSLDEFNRGLVFLLYKTYTNYLPEKESSVKKDVLRQTISSFPEFIQASIKELKEPVKKEKLN